MKRYHAIHALAAASVAVLVAACGGGDDGAAANVDISGVWQNTSGGFVYAGWCESPECEEKVKAETKATIRVIPGREFRSREAPKSCAVCGKPSAVEVVWARAY